MPRVQAFPPRHHDSLYPSHRCRGACHGSSHEFTAPAFFPISGRSRGSAKLSTTACGRYKLTVPPAPPCIQAAIAPAPTLDHPPARTDFPFSPNPISATAKPSSPSPAQFRSVPVPCFLVCALSHRCDACQTLNLLGVASGRRERVGLAALLSAIVARAP
jgi:hypothetical protein